MYILGCYCTNIRVEVKNNALIHQSSKIGSYEVSEKINGEPTWVLQRQFQPYSKAIWYSRIDKVWFIGALSDIGERNGGIVAFKKGGFSCPYEATIDVILFYNSHTDIRTDISKDITIQCTTPLQGEKNKDFYK